MGGLVVTLRRGVNYLPGVLFTVPNVAVYRLRPSVHVALLLSLAVEVLIMDLVMCYNIVFGLTCLEMSDFFAFSPVQFTRGHPYKLFVPRTAINTRKHFFCVCVIEP